jgi:hypothetical protein
MDTDKIKLVTVDKAVKDSRIPVVCPAKGNVPTSEEYNSLVKAFNLLVERLKDGDVLHD